MRAAQAGGLRPPALAPWAGLGTWDLFLLGVFAHAGLLRCPDSWLAATEQQVPVCHTWADSPTRGTWVKVWGAAWDAGAGPPVGPGFWAT